MHDAHTKGGIGAFSYGPERRKLSPTYTKTPDIIAGRSTSILVKICFRYQWII